jgi:hypothetical protein
MTTTALLEREPIAIPKMSEEVELRVELAREAEKKLGYSALTNALAEQGAIHELPAALSGLGIQPFSLESVQTYQAAKLAEVNGQRKPSFFQRHAEGVFVALVLVVLASFLAGLTFAEKGHRGLTITCFVLTGVSFLSLASAEVFEPKVTTWHWGRRALQGYPGEIPEFILQRALAIQEKVPEAEFYVEHLSKERRVADPFLVVSHARRSYYVDVWEEPRFEGRLRSAS